MVVGCKRAAQESSFFPTDVMTGMVITKEQTCGPVAPLYRFKTEKEVIARSHIATKRTTRGPAGIDIMMPET